MKKTFTFVRKYWLLILFGVALALVPFWTGQRWLFQPFLLIFFVLLATQVGSMCAKQVFIGLVKNLPPEDEQVASDSQEDEQSRQRRIQLEKLIRQRAQAENQKAAAALESFLSQVVGTWATVVLTFGLTIVLLLREITTGVPNPTWLPFVLIAVLLLVASWVVGLFATGALGSKPIIQYYDRNAWYPPKGALTSFRIAMLIAYSLLVVAAHFPNPNLQLKTAQEKATITQVSTNQPPSHTGP